VASVADRRDNALPPPSGGAGRFFTLPQGGSLRRNDEAGRARYKFG